MKKLYIIIPAILCSTFAAAQTMTLKECLEKGVNNSYQIRLVKISEEKAANNDSWSYAGGMPSVNISGGYSGSVSNSDVTLASDGSTVSNRDVFDQTLNASVRADWTLFEGFSIQAARNLLEEMHRQGTIRTRTALEDYIANLTSEYYNLVRQTIRLKNLEYAAALSKERLRIVSSRYDMGGDSRLDLKQAQVYFNADSARSLKQREALASANIRINRLMSNQDLTLVHHAADTAINLIEGLDYQTLYDDMILGFELFELRLQWSIVYFGHNLTLAYLGSLLKKDSGYLARCFERQVYLFIGNKAAADVDAVNKFNRLQHHMSYQQCRGIRTAWNVGSPSGRRISRKHVGTCFRSETVDAQSCQSNDCNCNQHPFGSLAHSN
jgi:hypothetical protein